MPGAFIDISLIPLDVFKGYNAKTQHPMYMTSAMDYG
jgi:hypothetical protein